MKKIIFLVLALIVLTKVPTQTLEICNIATVKQALPPVIFFETTIDGPQQPVFITRFLHNKIGVYGSQFTKCYFNALDLNYINSTVGLVALVSLLFFLYKMVIKKYYIAIAIFALLPIIPFVLSSDTVLVIGYKIFAIIGLGLLLF